MISSVVACKLPHFYMSGFGRASQQTAISGSRVAGYKINSNKSVAFLYLKDKQAEKEIRKTTHFTIVTNNIKYCGVLVCL